MEADNLFVYIKSLDPSKPIAGFDIDHTIIKPFGKFCYKEYDYTYLISKLSY